jgi:Holliday junction resolvase RusA-like endonuclease
MTLHLEIPRIPVSLNILLRMHWRYQRKDAQMWQQEIRYGLLTQCTPLPKLPYAKARVSIHRQSRGQLDPDGLVGCVKHIVDALRYAHVLVDDSPDHLVLIVTQEQKPKAAPRTLIDIQEVTA